MTNELAIASAEINEILKYLSVEQVNKIPKKLRILFEEIAEKDYIPHINPNKRIIEQDITPKTRDILIIFYRKYWANNEMRQEIGKKLIENERKYQKELREKYNPDNIFKTENKEKTTEVFEKINVQNEVSVVEYKESILKKLINKIKSIFNK